MCVLFSWPHMSPSHVGNKRKAKHTKNKNISKSNANSVGHLSSILLIYGIEKFSSVEAFPMRYAWNFWRSSIICKCFQISFSHKFNLLVYCWPASKAFLIVLRRRRKKKQKTLSLNLQYNVLYKYAKYEPNCWLDASGVISYCVHNTVNLSVHVQ